MPVELTLERQKLRFDCDSLGIGRGGENQISLPDDSRLEPNHAVLKQVNGRWIIESRDGGPVRIGNGRPVRFAWLNSGDVIHLTESGPDLLFELPQSGQTPTAPQAISLPVSVVQPIPASSTQAVVSPVPAQPAPSHPRVSVTPPPFPAPQKVGSGHDGSVSPFIPADFIPRQRSVLIAVAITGIVVGVGAWMSLPRSKPQTPVVEAPDPTPPITTPIPAGNVAKTPVEPEDFLVLIGIGDLVSGNRPHVLGVGWLWNERTAVVSRTLGDFLTEVLAATKLGADPRQACVIHGIPVEIGDITSSSACPEISVLRLKESAGLTAPARDAWHAVKANDVELMRQKGKTLTYVSYATLPKAPNIKGNHGFPMIAFDPDLVHMQTQEAKLLYEQRRHLLKDDDPATRLERGGLLIDQDRRIVGMADRDSTVIWTDALEQALGSY